MDILINLLPPEKKNLLNQIYLILFLRFVIEILLFYSLIVAVSLVLVNYFLQNNLASVQERTASLDVVYQKVNQEIKETNQQLQNLALAQKEVFNSDSYLDQVFRNIPAAISLNGLTLSRENKLLTLQGASKTRPDLLLLKEKLQQFPWIKNLDLPVSSLTTKENINFTLTAQLFLP